MDVEIVDSHDTGGAKLLPAPYSIISMDCRVSVEAAIRVYDIGTADAAVRVAIAKTGEMLNPNLSYVEIDPGARTTPSDETVSPAFLVANDALVALELQLSVFTVEDEVHASRIALAEIGQKLDNISLTVLDVEVLADDDGKQPNDKVDTDQQ